MYKQNQLLYIQTWKKHVSQKQLIKFIPNTNSSLYNLLTEEDSGKECLSIMQLLKKSFLERDNYQFFENIDKLSLYMQKHNKIKQLFPQQIPTNVKILMQFSGNNKSKNTIYLTKKHKLACALCNKFVVGNQSKKKTCLCSTLFFHETCYNSYSKKCKICGYIYGL